MLMKKEHHKRSPQEKEKILLDIQSLGVNAGCRKYNLAKGQYYDWLDRYNAHGLDGLEDRRVKNISGELKRLEKENRLLKELLADRELESKMKDELLKKKRALWEKKDKRNREIFFFREKPHPFAGIGSSHEDFFVVNKNSNFEIPVLTH